MLNFSIKNLWLLVFVACTITPQIAKQGNLPNGFTQEKIVAELDKLEQIPNLHPVTRMVEIFTLAVLGNRLDTVERLLTSQTAYELSHLLHQELQTLFFKVRFIPLISSQLRAGKTAEQIQQEYDNSRGTIDTFRGSELDMLEGFVLIAKYGPTLYKKNPTLSHQEKFEQLDDIINNEEWAKSMQARCTLSAAVFKQVLDEIVTAQETI